MCGVGSPRLFLWFFSIDELSQQLDQIPWVWYQGMSARIIIIESHVFSDDKTQSRPVLIFLGLREFPGNQIFSVKTWIVPGELRQLTHHPKKLGRPTIYLLFFYNILFSFYLVVQALRRGSQVFSSCPAAFQFLSPWPGIQPVSPGLAGRFLTTRPLGSPFCNILHSGHCWACQLSDVNHWCGWSRQYLENWTRSS